MIEREILAVAPGVQIVPPALPPVMGAALIALEAAGVRITPQLLARMRSEAPGLEANPRTGVTPPSSPTGQ